MTRMTATLQIELRVPGDIELIGDFLEAMNVVAVRVASAGRVVTATGLVMSLVPADPEPERTT